MIRKLLEPSTTDDLITADQKRKLSTDVNEKLNYFIIKRGFGNEALALFTEAMIIIHQTFAQRSFLAKKALLNWQVQFLK